MGTVMKVSQPVLLYNFMKSIASASSDAHLALFLPPLSKSVSLVTPPVLRAPDLQREPALPVMLAST